MKELMGILGNNPDLPKHVREHAEVKKVAQEFESVLINQLMQSMRKTVGDNFLNNMGKETFTAMLDQEYAKMASTTGTFGLASVLEEQLGAGLVESNGERYLREHAWMSPVGGEVGNLSKGQRFGADRPVHSAHDSDCEHDHGHVKKTRAHMGLDFARRTGTPVRAASEGVINRIERNRGSAAGLWVGISHGEGVLNTRYMHLDSSSEDLKVGDKVRIGQQIGEVGNTGTASRGAHLHFEIFERDANGKKSYLDPEPYVRMWDANALSKVHGREKEEDFAKVSSDSGDVPAVGRSGLRPGVLGKFGHSRYQLGQTGGGK